MKKQRNTQNGEQEESSANVTNPFALGNLFETTWHQQRALGDRFQRNNVLNKSLLAYYVSNGFGSVSNCGSQGRGSQILRKVMLETAARGDIEGMWFMSKKGYFQLNDKEICCMAGAAGQLEALKWLRGEILDGIQCGRKEGILCPWDPTEVHREAAENSHNHIIEYVEKNCEGHQIQMSYGVGLPW